MKERVTRTKYLAQVADRVDLPKSIVSKVYHGMVEELYETVLSGDRLVLTGFGAFELQKHAGHMSYFNNKENNIDPYLLLRFSTADSFIERIRENGSDLLKTMD